MTIAPMLGPTMRARLKPLELSAIAPGRSSRPTSSTISDCRAGISNAVIDPVDERQREQPTDRDVVATT